jgi:hypothetical protein
MAGLVTVEMLFNSRYEEIKMKNYTKAVCLTQTDSSQVWCRITQNPMSNPL